METLVLFVVLVVGIVVAVLAKKGREAQAKERAQKQTYRANRPTAVARRASARTAGGSVATPAGQRVERQAVRSTGPAKQDVNVVRDQSATMVHETKDDGTTVITYRRQVVITETIVAQADPVIGPAWVVDGDTIVINKMTIRLYGIDAPEMDHPYGVKSKWAMFALCKGQVITAIPDGSLSHDRCVARCYLPDGRDLSAELVKEGLAIDWPKYSGGEYRKYEVEGVRKKLWRAHNRQTGRYVPPATPPT